MIFKSWDNWFIPLWTESRNNAVLWLQSSCISAILLSNKDWNWNSVNISCSRIQNDCEKEMSLFYESYLRKITHVYTCGPITISIQLKTFYFKVVRQFVFYYSKVSQKTYTIGYSILKWFSFIFISSTDSRLSATHSYF